MQSVIGETFRGKNGEVTFSDIEQCQVICLLFTANWCPPCRIFSPILVEFYNDVNFPDKRLEIIHVTSDKDEASFNEHFEALPWICIPFGDSRLQALKHKFKIAGIPVLLVLNRDGSLAHGTARADVQSEGPSCFERWVSLVN